MDPIAILVAAAAAGAILLIVLGLAGSSPVDPVQARLTQLGTMEAKNLEELELQQPFLERTLRPLAASMSGRMSRVASSSFTERTEKRLALAGNPGELRVSDWLGIKAIGAVVGGTAGAIIGAQMDKQAKELEQNIKGATIERVGEGIQVTFASGLLYDFDSDFVRPEARINLTELAKSLSQYPNSDLLIIGHTDQVGSTGYNLGLSERRANAAATYLTTQGVSGTRMATRGLGESEPVGSNDTEAGRQANRRVEVAIFANAATRAAGKQ